jgi:hypothetical protein
MHEPILAGPVEPDHPADPGEPAQPDDPPAPSPEPSHVPGDPVGSIGSVTP